MNVQWVKIRSWHALRPDPHGVAITFCGKPAEGLAVSEQLPGGKSCESCLRIVVRINDDAAKAAA